MSAAAAIGDPRRVAGLALAGAAVWPATDAVSTRAAWEALASDTALVILSPEAFEHLGHRLAERPGVVWAVLPG